MTDEEATKKKILVVDDEQDTLTYLDTFLSDNGYRVVRAKDGAEGLAKARAEKPDLITLDITMPERSGVGLYRDLRQNPELGGVPIVIVTAVTGYGDDPEEFRKFISSRKSVPPPDGFAPKPIDRDALIGVIRDLIG